MKPSGAGVWLIFACTAAYPFVARESTLTTRQDTGYSLCVAIWAIDDYNPPTHCRGPLRPALRDRNGRAKRAAARAPARGALRFVQQHIQPSPVATEDPLVTLAQK